MKLEKRLAFTITEMIVVVVILGVLAGIAIPNYNKTIERSHVQDAINQLSALHAAETIQFARTGSYWPASATTYLITDINTNLKLNIIENDMTYSCQGFQGATFTCQASRNPSGSYAVTVTEAPLSATNPACSGSCP